MGLHWLIGFANIHPVSFVALIAVFGLLIFPIVFQLLVIFFMIMVFIIGTGVVLLIWFFVCMYDFIGKIKRIYDKRI